MANEYNISGNSLFDDLFDHEKASTKRNGLDSPEDLFTFFLKDFACVLIITDAEDGKILFINDYAIELHNLNANEIIGKTTLELGFFPSAEDRDKVIKHFLIDNKKTPFYGINFFRSKEHHYEIKVLKKIEYRGKPCILTIANDVTRYINAQQELKESEENFRNMLNNHSSIILLVEPDTGKIIQANPSAIEFYGFTFEEFMQKSVYDLNILSNEEVKKRMLNALNTKVNVFQFEHRIASGEIKNIEVHSSPVQLSGKKLLFSIIHDITKRRNTERLLEESEERFKKIFELAPDPYYLNDMKGNLIDGNLAAEKILGYTREELIGQNILRIKLLPASYLAKAAKNLFKHTIGKPTGPDHFQLIRKDGKRIDVEIMSTPIKIQGKKFVLGICRDIRKRISIENQLKAQYNFMNMLINTIPIPFYYKDNELRYIGCNRAFAKILGLQIKDIRGKTNHELWDKDTADFFTMKNNEILNHHNSQNYITKIRDRSGKLLTVINNSSVYYATGRNPAGIIGLMQDITEMKETEKELQEAIAAKNKFFSIIAHDLKSPLSGFIGLTKMLNEDTKNLSLSSITEISNHLNNSANHLFKLLENLLYWSKLQQGSIELNPVSVRISSVVKSIVQLFNLNIQEKAIDLQIDINDDVMINVDLNMLETAIRNLLSNAIKFSENGSTIKIYFDNKNGTKSLSVKDHGVGIPDKNIKRLFKLEESFSTHGTNKERGSGLGLIITKELIEKNSGSLLIKSAEGKGSTFTIVFNE